MNTSVRKKLKEVPTDPGVYSFYDSSGTVLYIGKARNLRHRVPSYFLRSNVDRGPRLGRLMDSIVDLRWVTTESEIEALLLEAKLIQHFKPKYNVEWRDDKSYLHVEIDVAAPFPQIHLVRRADVGRNSPARYFGPYTSPRALKYALRFIRRILPYCEYSFAKAVSRKQRTGNSKNADHRSPFTDRWFSKPCLYYHLGLCPGVCAGQMSLADYRRRVRQIVYFFAGKKDKVIVELKREMDRLAKAKDYEQAARVRNSWSALLHLKDISLRRGAFEEKTMAQRGAYPRRIEAYDVSNIFGQFAVGAMVVFVDGQPVPSEYKRFKIMTVRGISDTGALMEVLRRRFRHADVAEVGEMTTKNADYQARSSAVERQYQERWPLPNLLMIDGGKGQLNAAVKVLTEFGLQIPILAIAKGRGRKRADQYTYGPRVLTEDHKIRQIRDAAHRFAISYYRLLHRKGTLD